MVIATAFGPSTNTEALLKQILFEGPEAASPSLFMESVANAPAAQIAIALQARGASLTVCQREAGPLLALGTGAAEIAAGRAGRVLAGAVDEMTPLLHALLDRFGALARAGADGEELARPFDRRRNGFLAGEGATVAVLESAGCRSRGRGGPRPGAGPRLGERLRSHGAALRLGAGAPRRWPGRSGAPWSAPASSLPTSTSSSPAPPERATATGWRPRCCAPPGRARPCRRSPRPRR